jgi:hypothetical protein
MRVLVSLNEPKQVISPAACQVEPEVRRSRSRTSTSVSPARARWYATDIPMTPPPTTTTRARSGREGSGLTPPTLAPGDRVAGGGGRGQA